MICEEKETKAIAAAIESLDGETIAVDCDDCGEWDGVSRRCECGNRRCYWETETDSNGDVVAYPMTD
jgi:hypothetical protein